MSGFSPTLHSLRRNGLHSLLFDNDKRRDELCITSSPLGNEKGKDSHTENRPFNAYEANRQANNAPTQARHFEAKNTSGDVKQAFTSHSEQFSSKASNTTQVTNPNTQSPYSQAPRTQYSAPAPTNNLQQAQRIQGTQNTAPQEAQTKKNKTLPLENWSDEWLNVHKRFGLPRAENTDSQIRVAWTYAGLEQDVLAPTNPQRQAIIKKLVAELNHKQGTHSFIPYSLLHEDNSSSLATYQDATFFWSAMRLVRPRVLLIFGSVARDALNMPKILVPLQKINMGALQILQMHKPETLADDANNYATTLAFLQEYLKFCPKKQS